MADEIWECVVRQTQEDVERVNVIHLISEDGADDAETVMDAVGTAWCGTASIARAVQTIDIHYVGLRARNITTGADASESPWTGGVSTGQINTETTPPGVAFVNTLRTGLAGRSNRGRMYLSGCRHNLYATQQTQWNLASSAGIEASGAVVTFLSLINGESSSLGLAVYSRKLGTARLVTEVIPRSGLGTIRNRNEAFASP
jgi:hypothetical protein